MRRLTLLFLIVITLSGLTSAQEGELELNWAPVRNTVTGSVEIFGSANIPDQFYFFMEAAPWDSAEESPTWMPVTSFQMSPVVNDVLGAWNTTIITDGFYQLRLHAVNSANESFHYVLAAHPGQQRWRARQSRTRRGHCRTGVGPSGRRASVGEPLAAAGRRAHYAL